MIGAAYKRWIKFNDWEIPEEEVNWKLEKGNDRYLSLWYRIMFPVPTLEDYDNDDDGNPEYNFKKEVILD